jgi:hypothetical protein
MGYLGLVMVALAIWILPGIYKLRKENPEVHAKVPPWQDIRIYNSWIALILGLIFMFGDFVCHGF